MKRVILAAAAIASLGAATPAAAGRDDFRFCDGYKAPTRRSDGIAWDIWSFGVGSVATREAALGSGTEEIARCDAALVDPLLKPQFWLRRSHLLQAKAIHQIHTGALDAAMASLAASDGVAPTTGDVYFAQSIALGNRALRAHIYFKLGKAEMAMAELDAIDRVRPFSADMRHFTRSVRLANIADLEQRRALMLASAPIEPEVLPQLFWIAIFQGDFAQAIALSPQLSFVRPAGDERNIIGADARRYGLIETRADMDGATAYALAATGQGDAARAAMMKARDALASATQPPTPSAPGRRVSREAMTDYEARQAAGGEAARALDRWDSALALREQAAGMTLDAIARAIRDAGLRDSPVLIDILSQAKLTAEADIAARRQTIAALEVRRAREFRQVWELPFADFVAMLPRPEWEKMRPQYRAGDTGFLAGNINGYYLTREPGSPYISIQFLSAEATRPMVEELGLLAAAKESQRLGKDSFLIDNRMIIERTYTFISWHAEGSFNHSNGNETRLRILPVNAAELPAALEHSRWRLIKVADVIAALEPRYPPRRGGE